MAINPQVKEDTLDQTRELLIAISQALPENIQNSKSDKELPNGNHSSTAATNGDTVEELRSELIAISYTPSPDEIALPAMGLQEL